MPTPPAVAKPHSVRIIGTNNGMGLSRDREVIGSAFRAAGWDVSYAVASDKAPSGPVAVNVHLEIFCARLIDSAGVNIVIPNPEWWEHGWTAWLKHASVVVWAKTRDTARIFGELGARVEWIGFRSADRRISVVRRERAFLHVAGASPNKGTLDLVGCWQKDWLRLTVISARSLVCRLPNVTVLRSATDAEVRQLQNENLFHIYPSLYEGFGHAQWEGLSCGAIVFATDGPPFNEHGSAFRLLDAADGDRTRLIVKRAVTKEAVRQAVEWSQGIADSEVCTLRDRSRASWLEASLAFGARIKRLVAALDAAPVASVDVVHADSPLPPLVYVGRINCITGQGAAARHQIHVLRKHGFRLRIADAGSCSSPDPRGQDAFVQAARASDSFAGQPRGTIFHVQPNLAEPFRARSFPRPHILVSVWETTLLPAAWVPLINAYDQVWCATEWQRDVYLASGIREELLRVVPFALDPALYGAQVPREPDGRTVFGSMFQWSERKDPSGLISSFVRAFPRGERVVLRLKSYEGDRPTTSVAAKVDAVVKALRVRTPPSIEVISSAMDGADVAAFYRSIDCYVSAHRGEGFGLPIAEALLSGRPVIATGWSAPAEYASGLFRSVKHTLKPPHGMDWQPFYTADQRWAQADHEDLARAMREANEGRLEYSAKRVRERFSQLVERAGSAATEAIKEVIR